MALIVDSVCGIRTVGDLIAALEEFPDDLPVRVGLSEALTVSRRKPKPGDLAKYRRGFLALEVDRDEG
jgi:hypothetical protein